MQMIVLEGSVNKIRDGRVLSTVNKNQTIGEDVTDELTGKRKVRNYYVKAHTPVKIMLLSRNAYSTTKGMYDMDRERLCHRLLQKVPIMREWPLTKIVDVSDHI